MNNVKVELWMWLGKELGNDFNSPSEMKSILEICVEDGTTVRKLFKNLADRYRPIEENIFSKENNILYPNIVITFNDRVISHSEIYERVLKEGDKIVILPTYMGGDWRGFDIPTPFFLHS